MNHRSNSKLLSLAGEIGQYPEDVREEILKLLVKMVSLNFMATFSRMEEGPVVRTYFFEPFPDAPLNKIFSRDEDLALILGVESVLVTRELNYISIAIPRKDREIIRFDKCLYEMLQSREAREQELPLLMGKNTKGEALYADLAKQPHMLIAGSTGAGKSIFTSQLILSLSLLKKPSELEFILADTKQLDLVLFRNLSHVSEVHTDVGSLRISMELLLEEVRTRTSRLSGICRNIQEWNRKYPSTPMTYKILIIDEFANVVKSDREFLKTTPKAFRPQGIEEIAQQLAQIARAVGIHIIIATQRPSVKLISGDTKSNFPARIAFKLATMQDSRVILDENGAEKLLGCGDYLYKTATSDVTKRAHAAFVSMQDIRNMISQHEMLRNQLQTMREV